MSAHADARFPALAEKYWPLHGDHVTWDPVVLRSWCEMHLRSSFADCQVNAGVVLFLLDEWEANRSGGAA